MFVYLKIVQYYLPPSIKQSKCKSTVKWPDVAQLSSKFLDMASSQLTVCLSSTLIFQFSYISVKCYNRLKLKTEVLTSFQMGSLEPEPEWWGVTWAWVGGYSAISTLVIIFNIIIVFSVISNKYLHYSYNYVIVMLSLRFVDLKMLGLVLLSNLKPGTYCAVC